MLVIARAYKDKPLRRTVVGDGPGVLFVHNQDASAINGTVDKSGVGFPKDCVFPFDSTMFQRLECEWAAGNKATLAELWARMVPVGEMADA